MICRTCQKEFTIFPRDAEFYKSINMPEPADCPACRRARLLAWRNQRNLYSRKCDKTGKNIISIFAPDAKYTVYDRDYWWSDDWDSGSYGQDYDFNRPFFEQFNELIHRVPMAANFNAKSVNSQYCNHVGEMKNCYLVFASWVVEDSMYSDLLLDSRDCLDVLECGKSERCYEDISCHDCYNTHYSLQASNCLDSYFLFDCRACSNCVGCINLRNKKYHIFNQPYSPSDYQKKLQEFNLDTRTGVEALRWQFLELKKTAIHRYALLLKCQNSTGDNLTNAKDCFDCYNSNDVENCSYSINGAKPGKDIYDSYGFGADHERGYFLFDSGAGGMDNFFCGVIWGSSFAHYSYNCHSCTEIFGCTGLRGKKYCILNKQYSEEDYEVLKNKIIEQMKKTGEWGEFFPSNISPFGFNETIAYEYYQPTKEEALAQGLNWQDNLPGTRGLETLAFGNIPEVISEVKDNIVEEVLACINCARNYKIIPQELKFYKDLNIPLPIKCPNCRYQARRNLRNPHQLWHRQCMCEKLEHGHIGQCTNEFETTYAPERPELVYCEFCYQSEIY